MRRLVVVVPVALLAAACGGGSHAPTTTAQGSVGPKRLHVSITAQSHRPKLGHTWTYQVRVTDAATGKPVAAKIHLQFWFSGVSVGEVGTHTVANGVWKETIPAKGKDAFPPASLGQPLVLHATVTAKGYTKAGAGWKVSVVK